MRLKIAQQECCNLRLKVENAEHQNRAITKEVERKKKEVKMKASEEAILRKKLNDLSNYSDNFNLLKKNLVALYHEYGDHGQSSKCSMGDGLDDQNFNERKSNLIKKKIEKTLLIIEKNRILHHSQVSKLKRDRCILDAVSVLTLINYNIIHIFDHIFQFVISDSKKLKLSQNELPKDKQIL